MIHRVLTRTTIFGPLTLLWLVVALFVLVPGQSTPFVVAPFVLLVPGLCVLWMFRIRRLAFWGYVASAVGMSVFVLMIVGLLVNGVGPHLGLVRPLDTMPMLVAWSGILGILFLGAWLRVEPMHVVIPRYLIAQTPRELVLILAAASTIPLSVFGAIRLTNGASNTLTMVSIGVVALVVGALVTWSTRVSRTTVPTVLYLVSLSLLLMTSLRGTFVSGHDIMREFFVFDLTYRAGLWDMAAYRDAYNACLSITIVPTIFTNLFHIAQPYVYKVLFQVIFALTPVIVYLTSRVWVDRRLASSGAVLFLAFPTFFQDMPFLARQEIAFLFFGLMVYFMVSFQLPARTRRILFVLMGCGVVLSHYSTMYLVLALFVLVLTLTPLLRRGLERARHFSLVRGSALIGSSERGPGITILVVAILLCTGVVWVLGITQSGDHALTVARETVHAITGPGGDRSFDVDRLFSFVREAPDVGLAGYERDVVAAVRAAQPDDTYDSATYAAYPFTILRPEYAPPLGTGTQFAAFGARVTDIALLIGSVAGKIVQFSVLLGLIYVLRYRVRVRSLDLEYYTLALVAVCLVLATAILPVLSNEYGLFRALQQALFVLAPFLAVGVVLVGLGVAHGYAALVRKFYQVKADRSETVGHALATSLVVVVLLYATGFVEQLVGGSLPAFHLANTGDDYRRYLITDEEFAAGLWLRDLGEAHIRTTGAPIFVVQTDRFFQNKLKALIMSGVSQDLFPGALLRGAHVVVGGAVLRDQRAAVAYGGTTILYEYPVEFLDTYKDVVYTNGSVRVYR